MAKISELADGGNLLNDDELIVLRAGGNVRATVANLPEVDASGNQSFADGAKAIFGTGDDLQIYHTGSHSFIQDTGVGDLYLATNGNKIILRNTTLGESFFEGTSNGDAKIFYNGLEKLATTSTGIDVTGSVTADGLTVDTATGSASPTPSTITIATSTSASDWSTTSPWGKLAFYSADASGGGAKEQATLDVVCSQIQGGVSDFRINTYNSGAKERLRVSYDGDISFYEDTGTTAKLFWDASAESLGIGTSTPDTLLELVGDDPILTIRDSATGSATANATLRLAETGASDTLDAYWDIKAVGGALQFIDNWNEGGGTGTRLVIDDSGNVGIGTDSPAAKLHVYQSANNIIQVGSAGTSTAGIDLAGDGATAGTDSYRLYQDSGKTAYVWNYANTPLRIGTNNAERMRIDSAGRVGIGTSSPNVYGKTAIKGGEAGTADSNLSLLTNGDAQGEVANLAFYGTFVGTADNGPRRTADITAGFNAGSWGSEYLSFNVGKSGASNDTRSLTNERMRIDSSGNVGIGTSSPSAPLAVESGSAGDTVASFKNSGFFGLTITPQVGGSGTVTDIRLGGGESLSFSPNNTEAMRIDYSGHVIAPNGVTLGTAVGTYAAANTLDDYEEGTFTPVLADATSGGNVSSTTGVGSYTKVGRLVTATVAISNIDTTGLTGSNTVYVRGLPFATSDIPGLSAYYTTGCLSSAVTATGAVNAYAFDGGTTWIGLTDGNNILASDLTSGAADIYFTLSYQTA